MTIEIKSWVEVIGFFMLASGFISALAVLHWKLFLYSRMNAMLEPLRRDVSVTSRIMREKYREEYEQAEEDARRANALAGVNGRVA